MPEVNFLLIEDNDDDVTLVRESFADSRLTNPLHVVSTGEDALAFLRKQGRFSDAPDVGLILLDINMPGMSGFDALDAMKADPTLSHIPVVVLTTSGRDEDIVRSYACGACSYIRKPVGFEDFKEAVRHFALYWTVVAELPKRNV